MLEILQEMGQIILAQLTWWKIFVALSGSVVITAIALGILVWAERRSSNG
ncbi:MAG: hypothetical protein AAGD25_04495 [Cyanobacteria bacterium P01_F01_bin.150]